MEERFDPYKHKERYSTWKESVKNGIPGISKYNSEIIMQYLGDMEIGINISMTNKKGARSPIRLNGLRTRMVMMAKRFEQRYLLDKITDLDEERLITFFAKMRSGEIEKEKGGKYASVRDYAKIFKAFWHWHQRINRKQGIEVPDITVDLDTSGVKPKWVYLDEKQIKLLYENANFKYKTLILFLFDTGIRSPTELMNIKVSDLYNDYKELNIRDEVSKTFGRRIKLMLCSDVLKSYIEEKEFQPNDQIFKGNPHALNRYLKRLARRVLGDKESLAGKRYPQLTMYDFRHCSCCYWLPRYKSESALKFRFGWKKSDKIHYYSEMLGMRDTITEDDILIDTTKTELEQKLVKMEQSSQIKKEKIEALERQVKVIFMLVKKAMIVVKEGDVVAE